MNFIQLTLYRTGQDARPATPVYVNFSLVQVLEPFTDSATRIQFNLNEPALIVQESVDKIQTKLGA